jgi:hypothetical protein
MRSVGVKLDKKHWEIVCSSIDLDLGEDISQVMRRALREFAKNHGIMVKKSV